MRYVGRIGARQSSAGSVTYVSAVCCTGLLRTCNALRIAGLPVLRNDGGRSLAVLRNDGGGNRAGQGALPLHAVAPQSHRIILPRERFKQL
ncbi:MAG: hypothetical protein LBM98_13605 [Oscillospiraceae bacterium]|nr:hypothetical protein [Oscillospiraceae bacterium]